MKTAVLGLVCAAVIGTTPARAGSDDGVLSQLVSMERKAMDGWLKGDPEPQLSVVDPEITYIHDVTGTRLDGVAALKELYARYRGVALFDSYEILSPKCQATGEMAVLTYQLVQHSGAGTRYWNATQVYRKKAAGWVVIHTHWSAAKERQN